MHTCLQLILHQEDWEYEKPSYHTIMMLVIWHLHLQVCPVRNLSDKHLIGTYRDKRQFPHS